MDEGTTNYSDYSGRNARLATRQKAAIHYYSGCTRATRTDNYGVMRLLAAADSGSFEVIQTRQDAVTELRSCSQQLLNYRPGLHLKYLGIVPFSGQLRQPAFFHPISAVNYFVL